MPKTVRNDITGMKFNRLTAIEFIPCEGRHAKFLFLCDCGHRVSIFARNVITGSTQSCGCIYQENKCTYSVTHGLGKSGKLRSPSYSSWASMMTRSKWGHHPSYKIYGGAGIGVCEAWCKFENFYRDMGERPTGKSIDRIDNSKGYSPDNCRWATRHEQVMNRTNTVRVLIDNRERYVFELCGELGLSHGAVRSRAARRGNDYVAALLSFGVKCKGITPVYKHGRRDEYITK